MGLWREETPGGEGPAGPRCGSEEPQPGDRRPHDIAAKQGMIVTRVDSIDSMILPQVHLRKPCYDFSFL